MITQPVNLVAQKEGHLIVVGSIKVENPELRGFFEKGFSYVISPILKDGQIFEYQLSAVPIKETKTAPVGSPRALRER